MKFYIAGLLLFTMMSCHAKLGCMDTSSHLGKKIDFKNLRYVQCNCPCTSRAPARGNICLICRHYLNEEPTTVVHPSRQLMQAALTQDKALTSNPLERLRIFVKKRQKLLRCRRKS